MRRSATIPFRAFCAALARLAAAALVLWAPCNASAQAPPQGAEVTRQMRQRGHQMAQQLYKDLQQNYFDSTFGGVDMAARLRAADSAIDAAPTNNHILAALAQLMADLDDSHTNFLPPPHVIRVAPGSGVRFFGDSCFVVRVDSASDAAAKGLRVGDAVLAMDTFRMERRTYPAIAYVYYALSPRPKVRLTVRSPGGAVRTLDVEARVTQGERNVDYSDPDQWHRLVDRYEASAVANHRWVELGDSVMIWKMSSFVYGDDADIDDVMKRVRKHRALILDLRNNGGGAVATEEYLLGQFFDREVELGTIRERAAAKRWTARPRTQDPFMGLMVVLVNSGSASASEIFARVMQLEGRAIIVGDRSAGMVVTSRTWSHQAGFGRVLPYGAQISVADVVMSDGNRLEKVGVVPDTLVVPTGADLAADRDPALARALSVVGVTISPEEAGRLYLRR